MTALHYSDNTNADLSAKPLIVHVVFENFLNDSRIEKTAESLQKSGFSNKVIAIWKPGIACKQRRRNVEIYRIKLPGYYMGSKFHILFGLLYFSVSTLFLLLKWKPDVIHCHNLETSFPVLILNLVSSKFRYIYNSHELYYGTKLALKRSRIINKLLAYLERSFARRAKHIIHTTMERAQDFKMKYGIEAHVISNFPSLSYLADNKENVACTVWDVASAPVNARRLIYVGAIAPGRGLEIICDIVNRDHSLFLVVLGHGAEWSKEFICKADRLSNFYYHEEVEPSNVIGFIKGSDCGICLIEDVCLSYRFSMPTKLFEYIYAEIPVLGSPLPGIKRIIENCGEPLGTVVETVDSGGIKNGLDRLFSTRYPSERFRKAIRKYTWEDQENILSQMHSKTQKLIVGT